MKHSICVIFLLCICMFCSAACASEWYFPYGGWQIAVDDTWTVVNSDVNLLEADTPQGRVTVSSQVGRLPDISTFDCSPFENVGLKDNVVSFNYALEADNGICYYACSMVQVDDVCYTFTAASNELTKTNLLLEELLGRVICFTRNEYKSETEKLKLPSAIEDDGVFSPVALHDFSGITYEDTTMIIIQTVPGASVSLLTASDQLHRVADENGMCTFKLSTKREQTYLYTVVVKAEGRKQSKLGITLERRMQNGVSEAYRKAAVPLAEIGYQNLCTNSENFAEKAVCLHGMITAFQTLHGFPCALVMTSNPAKGVWEKPVWVLISDAVRISMGDVCTFYGDVTGENMEYSGEALPVIALCGFSEE